jgi:hypothetical protein
LELVLKEEVVAAFEALSPFWLVTEGNHKNCCREADLDAEV